MRQKPRVVILMPPRRGRAQTKASNDTYVTADAVKKALKAKGYEIEQRHPDPERSEGEGSSNGKFFGLRPQNDMLTKAVFFNLCEDFEGRGEGEAYVAGLLELLDQPYTGSPPESLLCCLHKDRAKEILAACGLPVPLGFLLSQPRLNGEQVRFPAMVKPAREDASVGISADSVVPNKSALESRLSSLHKINLFPVLVEEFIEGRELNVSILGDTALPLSEIDFSAEPDPQKRILTYEAKWEERSAAYRRSAPICPAKVDAATRKKLERLALDAVAALRCRDYARVDFRLRSDGEPFLLEVNPNPCLAPDAGFARSARAAGISYEELIEKILLLAVERKNG